MGDTGGHKPREPTPTRRLNPLSSGICQQNTHFNMYARTPKPLEGFTCKNSHAKCFKTTNSTAKLYRGAMYRDELLRAFSVVFPLLRNFQISTQESNANSAEISIYKTQFLTCNSDQKGKEGSLSKHCSRNVLKRQILIDSIIP